METYIITSGFFKYNIILVGIFAMITLLVSIFSYRLYRLTKENQIRLFSIAFLAFTAAYAVQLIINILILFKIISGLTMFEFRHVIIPLRALAIDLYAMLFIIGFAILAYMSMKISDRRILALILAMAFFPVLLTPQNLFLFHLMSSVMLAFIASYYLRNYINKPKKPVLIVLSAFILLFMSHISMIFSMHSGALFIIGRLFELAAYICILLNISITIRK